MNEDTVYNLMYELDHLETDIGSLRRFALNGVVPAAETTLDKLRGRLEKVEERLSELEEADETPAPVPSE